MKDRDFEKILKYVNKEHKNHILISTHKPINLTNSLELENQLFLSFSSELDLIENSKSNHPYMQININSSLPISHINDAIESFQKLQNNYSSNNINDIKYLEESLTKQLCLLHYQPVYSTTSQNIEFNECLLRIKDTNTPISAGPYIQKTENIKRTTLTDSIVTDMAIEQLSQSKDIVYSINISPNSILDNAWQNEFLNKLSEIDNPHNLIIEITETGNKPYQEINEFINKLHEMNFSLAMDDFGSQDTNIHQLYEFPWQYVKLDRALIHDIKTNIKKVHLLESIAIFCNKNNIKTVAEFIEDEPMLKIIKECGISCAQGNFLGIANDKPQK